MPKISERAVLMPSSPIRRLAPLAEEAKQRGTKVYHLNIGQPDIKTPQVALDAIRNIEDELNILKDWRDIEARRIVGETFAEKTYLEDEGRRINEWLDDEKIKIMEQ